MGVKGLWTLLEPVGKPVTLESLEGKILAVDVSIWLHQTVHGMRDTYGEPVANAHLVGLFNRVCKLLFYKIKPVFVFDGGVPELKKQTLANRRQLRADAVARSEETTKKLLTGLLKQHAIGSVLTGAAAGPSGSGAIRGTPNKPDMYQLPPMPEVESESFFDDEVEHTLEVRTTFLDMLTEEFQDPEDIDPESTDFQALPAELQYELLKELKEHRKQRRWNTAVDMPEDTEDFSKFQIKRMMNRCKLTQRLDGVRKEINAHASGDVVKSLTGMDPGEGVESQRLVSDDSASYILIRGLKKNSEDEKKKVLDDIKENHKENHDAVKTKQEIDEDSKDIVSHQSKSEDDKCITYVELEGKRKSSLAKLSETVANMVTVAIDHKVNPECLNTARASIINIGSNSDTGPTRVEDRHLTTSAVTGSKSQPNMSCAHVVTVESDSDTSDCICIDSGDEKPGLTDTISNVTVDEIEVFSDNDKPHEVQVDVPVVDIIEEGGFILDNSSSDDDLVEVSESTPRDCSVAQRTTGEPKHKTNLIGSDKSQEKDADVGVQFKPVDDGIHCSEGDSIKNQTAVRKDTDNPTVQEVSPMKDVCDATEMHIQVQTGQASNSECPEMLQIVPPGDRLMTTNTETTFPQSKKTIDTARLVTQDIEPVHSINPDKRKTAQSPTKLISIDSDDSTSEEDDFEMVPVVDEIALDVSYSPLAQEHLVEDEVGASGSEHAQAGRGSPIIINEETDSTTDILREVWKPVTSKPHEPPTEERQEALEAMQSQLEEESQTLEAERARLDRQAASITDTMTAEAQELLRLFGVPYIVSPMEAEAQCAYLDLTSQTAGTVTDDSDIWLFGGRRVYKNMFNHGKYVEHYSEASIHSQLLLDRLKLINLAFLCGSDYTVGIERVGPVTAMEVLAEFPGDGLQQLRDMKTWWNQNQHHKTALSTDSKLKKKLRQLKLPSGFPSMRVSDAYLKPEVDVSEDRFTWGKPDLDLLREYATQKLGWPQSKTDEFILPVIKKLSESSLQKHITSFFNMDFGEPRKLKSKRVKNVLSRLKESQAAATGELLETQTHTTNSMTQGNTNSSSGSKTAVAKSPSSSKSASAKVKTKALATKRAQAEASAREFPSMAKWARQTRGGRGRSGGRTPTAPAPRRQAVDEVNLSESSSDE